MTPLAFIGAVTDARTVEDVWRLHTDRMGAYGFDRLLYGFTRFRTARSFGDPMDFLVLTNHPDHYVDRFLGEEMYLNAPMVRWAAENEGACSWRWILERAESMTEKERAIVAFNAKAGVTAGYSISFKDATIRAKGAIALTAAKGVPQEDVDALWAAKGREIEIMNNVVHLKITGLPYTAARRALTSRQRETLEWVGDGKTTQDIATIMGLTQATIEKHLRLAREALDVDTTAQAVLKASFQNQIFVLTP